MSSNRKILKTKRQLAPEPAKIKRTDSVFPLKFGTKTSQVKKENDSKKEFKSFHSDILAAYAQWMRDEHGVKVTMDDSFEKTPEFSAILAGQVDSIVQSEVGTWPVMVKTVYQSQKAQPKTVQEIVQNRDNSYIKMDEDGNWRVKEGSSVWYACQNILALYKFTFMNLIVYNPRNMDFLVIDVQFVKDSYLDSLEKLNDVLSSNLDSM